MQSESIEKMEAERQQVGAATHIRNPRRRHRGRRRSALTVQLIDELEIATMEHLSGLKDELESELGRGVLFGLDVEEPKVQVRCSGCSGFTPIVPPQGPSRPTAPPGAHAGLSVDAIAYSHQRSFGSLAAGV